MGTLQESIAAYRDRAVGIGLKYFRNRADAEDVAHDGLVKALEAAGRFEGEARISTWLNRIVANAARDLYRKRKIRSKAREGAGFEVSYRERNHPERTRLEDVLMKKEQYFRLAQGIMNLPDEQRQVVLDFYFTRMKQREIALNEDIPQATVGSRLRYAREKLRKDLAA